MSLVFLKNDDNSRDTTAGAVDNHLLPYRWSNYFTNPIKVKKNSQVAYVKSSFQVIDNGEVPASTIYLLSGKPELNPTIPIHLPENLQSLSWKEYLNNISTLLNQYSNNDTYSNNQNQQSGTFAGVNQSAYTYGFNVFLTADKKVQLTVVPRQADGGIYNRDYNAGFDINTTGLQQDDTEQFTLSSPIYDNGGTGIVDKNGVLTPDIGLGAGVIAPATNGTKILQGGKVNPVLAQDLLATFNGGPGFYNTGFGCGISDNQGNVLPSYGVGSNQPEELPRWDWGFVGAKVNSTPIKQYIGEQNATANGGGDTLQKNGYVVMGWRNFPQGFANNMFPAPPAGGQVGGSCLPNCFFGVIPLNMVHSYYSQPNPFQGFIANVDLNAATVNPGSANSVQDAPSGAGARYLLGCKLRARNGTQLLDIEVLDPGDNEGNGAGTLTNSKYKLVASYDILQLAAANNTTINVGTNLTAGRVASSIFFRFRWTSPYTMAVDWTLSTAGQAGTYRPDRDSFGGAPGSQVAEPIGAGPNYSNPDPKVKWIELYDMLKDPPYADRAYFIPKYMGDIGLIRYEWCIGSQFYSKGYYDCRKSYRRDENINNLVNNADSFEGFPYINDFFAGEYGNLKLLSRSQNATENSDKLGTIDPERFDADGFPKTDIKLLVNHITTLADEDKFQNVFGFPIFNENQPDTRFGEQIGIDVAVAEYNNDPAGAGTPYVAFEFNGADEITLIDGVVSNHIQLTNLPIQSQNGVKSTQNKTIAVVNTLCVGHNQKSTLGSKQLYCDTAPFLNWIDLNNYNDMELQKVDVLITNDDNKEATSLVDRTDVVVMFREKPTGIEPVEKINRISTSAFFNQ